MDLQLQLILQSAIVPFTFSYIVKYLTIKSHQLMMPLLFSAWLVSYLWIAGVPAFPPSEALDWIGFLGFTFIVFSYCNKLFDAHNDTKFANALFVVSGVLILTWPVMVNSIDIALVAELLMFAVAGSVIVIRQFKINLTAPALTLCINNVGLAVVSILSGSLIIGQLAGSLAAVLGVFIFGELFKNPSSSLMGRHTITLFTILNLFLLVTARIYAEIPLGVSVLLLISLLVGLISRWRYAFVLSILAISISLIWLLSIVEYSGYY